MTVPPIASPKRTPFHAHHQKAGARLVDFAGWEMPIQFEGILAEHAAVRERAGIFDISHMAPLWVTGPGARATLDRLTTNDVAALPDGRGMYTLLCREDGRVVDDWYIYRLEAGRYLVIANAGRAAVDTAWVSARLGPETELTPIAPAAALALQGPRAADVLKPFAPAALKMKKNDVAELDIRGHDVVVARTGYTGEDGFELFAPAAALADLYSALLEAGVPHGLALCGLGARDTLRLEMGYRLYGHDLDEEHTALESGLGWVVKLDKSDFIGRDALRREKEKGSTRRFVGLRLKERGVPREGAGILIDGRVVGKTTSGTFSPSLRGGIALGFVDGAATGADWAVVVHGRPVPADKVTPPFYRKI
jgi:aminomethyltransferase